MFLCVRVCLYVRTNSFFNAVTSDFHWQIPACYNLINQLPCSSHHLWLCGIHVPAETDRFLLDLLLASHVCFTWLWSSKRWTYLRVWIRKVVCILEDISLRRTYRHQSSAVNASRTEFARWVIRLPAKLGSKVPGKLSVETATATATDHQRSICAGSICCHQVYIMPKRSNLTAVDVCSYEAHFLWNIVKLFQRISAKYSCGSLGTC